MTYELELATKVSLVDHHCHSVMGGDLDHDELESLLTESDWPPPAGTSNFDSPVGIAVRSFCSPLLGLAPNSSAAEYVAVRDRLGAQQVNERLLQATGIDKFLIETGASHPSMLTVAELEQTSGKPCQTIARLEVIAESIINTAESAEDFNLKLAGALDEAAATGRGFKSIIAYRYGLDFDPDRPGQAEVAAAVEGLLAQRDVGTWKGRLADPVLMRHLIWEAVDRRRPLQFHVGYGDSDINLYRCDPTRMTEFIRRTRTSGSDIMLLHCYPFQREAAFLAQVYPHVYLDTGAAMAFTGFASDALVRESLELAPFGKILFSSDAYGLSELYLCNVGLWRRAIGRIFGEWVSEGVLSHSDAERYINAIAHGNAERVYSL
ncbi:amidohydrolase [Paenarthrobacter aurescens]|uniref:amidohydrolase n=1 Tax=Paenarthrobacter aurescens TaxID=43663 RepID=UPI0021C202C2|nr:amidohydrolase [Paenarthrobacter aurescens]